jgi:hypothetical protein
VRSLYRKLRRPARWALTRTNIALALLAFGLGLGGDMEERLYGNFVARNTTPEMSDRDKAMGLLQGAYDQHLLNDSRRERQRGTWLAIRRTALRSGDLELAQGTEGCGTSSAIFVEACRSAGLRARLCQMILNESSNKGAAHILAEVYVDGKWAVVDPICGQVFVGRDGRLAGYKEVAADWAYFAPQAKPFYAEQDLRFQGVRYTNWGKVPVLMPLAKWGLDQAIGKEAADEFSLRTYCLNWYYVYLALILGVICLYNLVRALLLVRAARRRQKAYLQAGAA